MAPSKPVITPDPGQELCYECDGKRTCLFCRGRGHFSDGARCHTCWGSGGCIVCDGAGQRLEGTRERLDP